MMPCQICGAICHCSDQLTAAIQPEQPRWLPEVAAIAGETRESSWQEAAGADDPKLVDAVHAEEVPSALAREPAEEDSSVWRQELASRLERYRSRRKPRPPRYPSLRLRFEEEVVKPDAELGAKPSPPIAAAISVISNHALALQAVEPAPDSDSEPFWPAPGLSAASNPIKTPEPMHGPARILEFPRSWTPPVAASDQLADPVTQRPRILEAPELVPPPPALGGITIEPPRPPDVEKRPGIDIPLRGANFGRRTLSAAVDLLVIAFSCVLFGLIFWKLTAIRPPRLQIVAGLGGLGAAFWAAYQYLLLVYTGGTPGLLLAGLRLVRFDDSPAGRKLRHWRVLASYLSALSLGMGYAWAFLDEDSLCWHDRITHTYLKIDSRD